MIMGKKCVGEGEGRSRAPAEVLMPESPGAGAVEQERKRFRKGRVANCWGRGYAVKDEMEENGTNCDGWDFMGRDVGGGEGTGGAKG